MKKIILASVLVLFLLVPLVNAQVQGIQNCIPNQKWCEDHNIWQCSSDGMTSSMIKDCSNYEVCEYQDFEPVCVRYNKGSIFSRINYPLVFLILVVATLVIYYMFFKGKRKKTITHKAEHKEEYKYCPKCGEKLNKGDKFCKKCGGKVK